MGQEAADDIIIVHLQHLEAAERSKKKSGLCSYSKNKNEVTKRRIIGVRERGDGSHVWLSAFWDQGSE